MPVSTKFDMRDDPNVVRNYGRMLVELASVIPDGIVAFFVSYSYMDTIVSKWDQMGVLQVQLCIFASLPIYCSCSAHSIKGFQRQTYKASWHYGLSMQTSALKGRSMPSENSMLSVKPLVSLESQLK